MINPKAVIDKNAVLAEDVRVGPYAIIAAGVQLGKGVTVSAHAHLVGNTYIGDNTFIGSGAIIGAAPQMVGIKESVGKVYIGKNNIIREYTTIHSSISQDKVTSIGNDNFLMAFSHIAHDCKLENNIVVCNGALIAGHVQVGDRTFISGNVVIHQYVRIGRLAMVGGLSRVNQDILPFTMVVGDSRVWGLNLVGLKRADFSKEDINQIRKAYNFLYRKNLSFKSALAELEKIDSAKVKEMVVFILSSKRGICGPKKTTFWEKIFLDYPYFVRTKIPTYNLFLKDKNRQLKI